MSKKTRPSPSATRVQPKAPAYPSPPKPPAPAQERFTLHPLLEEEGELITVSALLRLPNE